MKMHEYIQDALRRKGRSQAEAAMRMGVSPQVFHNMATGKRKVYADELVRLCFALDVSVEELFAEDDAREGA